MAWTKPKDKRRCAFLKLMHALIQHATKLCRTTFASGGEIVWELPERCQLWSDFRAVELTSLRRGFATIASSPIGWHRMLGEAKAYLKNKWKIWSSDPAIIVAFLPYQKDEEEDGKHFVEWRGRFARESVHYPKQMAQVFWRTLGSTSGKHHGGLHSAFIAALVAAATFRNSAAGSAHRGEAERRAYGRGHRQLDSPAKMLLWCQLITRVVKPKSAEAHCENAEEALKKELPCKRKPSGT